MTALRVRIWLVVIAIAILLSSMMKEGVRQKSEKGIAKTV
jgi:hypothetical protein